MLLFYNYNFAVLILDCMVAQLGVQLIDLVFFHYREIPVSEGPF